MRITEFLYVPKSLSSEAVSHFSEALMSDAEAVFICTPPSLHIGQSIRALNAGKHVFCEKPLSDSIEGTEELQKAIAESRKKFTVGYCFRFHDGLIQAKSYIESGKIGRLISTRHRMGENLAEVRPDYRGLFTLKENGVYDLSHEIDLACWFFRGEIRDVKRMEGAYGDLGFTAPDLAEVLIRFDEGLASVHLDYFSKPRSRVTELIGTEGTVLVEFPTWDSCTLSVFDSQGNMWNREILETERDDMFEREIISFFNAIDADTSVDVDLNEARKSQRIMYGKWGSE